MLTSIFVKNFVLIDEVSLDFQKGLSAFTGETGAGKSILMDAIGLLKGSRANAGMVKKNCDKALIEGVFLIEHETISKRLTLDGYDLEEGSIIVSREITKDGKSTARINHRVTSVSYIKEVISSIIDIHSQHDTQYLLNQRYHQQLLDNFIHADDLKQQVYTTYQTYKQATDTLQEALSNDYNEADLEYLTYQLNEIDAVSLSEHELEELETEQRRMLSYEKLSSALHTSLDKLENDSNPALYEAYKVLQNTDEELEAFAERLGDYYYQMEDIISQLHSYADHLEFDGERFNEIQERIFSIHKILRKYGGTYAAVMDKHDDLEQKIDSILHRQDFITKQEQQISITRASYEKLALALRKLRQKEAKALCKQIQQQLFDLELPHAKFEIELQPTEAHATGFDRVEFMIAMNAGEALKPLSQTASGGELSRLMLGLKTVFTSLMGIETVIFDEIDTGVSGKVALSIGKKMQELANYAQVFCVTHLAPVAASAKQHYLVMKQQEKEQTTTQIALLDDKKRIMELANIVSGSSSKSALDSASELYHRVQENR